MTFFFFLAVFSVLCPWDGTPNCHFTVVFTVLYLFPCCLFFKIQGFQKTFASPTLGNSGTFTGSYSGTLDFPRFFFEYSLDFPLILHWVSSQSCISATFLRYFTISKHFFSFETFSEKLCPPVVFTVIYVFPCCLFCKIQGFY